MTGRLARVRLTAVVASLFVLVLLTLPHAAADAHEGCAVSWDAQGRPLVDCSKKGQADDSWWASSTAQAVYAVLGLAGSAAAGGYAYYRVKTRRALLAGFMSRIDATTAANKASPEKGAAELAAIRGEIAAGFNAHKIDDAHFIELEKRAIAGISKMRTLELDHRFPSLPPALRSQVLTLVSDGKVSQTEVELIRSAPAGHLVPGRVRDDLLLMVETWAAQDSGLAVPENAPAAVEPKPAEPVVRLRPPS